MPGINGLATRPPRALADGEVLSSGRHRLRFLAAPHVPHGWDAGMIFEESERTLLCTELFSTRRAIRAVLGS